MSGANENVLLNVVNALHQQHIKPSADGWRDALLAARSYPADVDRLTVKLILAMAALQDAAKHAEAVLRQELAVSMERDGVTGFDTEFHSVVRAKGPRRAQVEDRQALAAAHPDLMIAQDPKPDMNEIARRLKAREIVTGASLSNGGPSLIRITAKTGTPT